MKQIIIEKILEQIRIGIVEDGILVNYFIDSEDHHRITGNFYNGRIEKILPGMNSAFINIGLDKNALIHISDACNNYRKKLSQNSLRIGQEILVQIKKDPIHHKGAKITTRYSLPGHFLVLLPNENSIYISKKIKNTALINEYKDFFNKIKPKDMGLIIRTEAENSSLILLEKEFVFLLKQWEFLENKYNNSVAPSIVYKSFDMISGIIREYYSSEVDEVIINDLENYDQIINIFNIYFPNDKRNVLYKKERDLFKEYNLESKINKLYNNKVWLTSGGYIIIDQTEALTVIDVNTGKYVGKQNLQDTILQTNLEAAKEIAHQLRLRNIGGIIIIDFIDMYKYEGKEQVIAKLKGELKKDKIKTKVLGMTKLGLVEMTRKHDWNSIIDISMQTCPMCNGSGHIFSMESFIYKIAKLIEEYPDIIENSKELSLHVNPFIAEEIEMKKSLKNIDFTQELKKIFGISFRIKKDLLLELSEIKIRKV